MAAWAEFERAAPDLAAAGLRLFSSEGIGWLATVRKDGAPRLHAVVPIYAEGRVGVFIPDTSPKRLDLLRDGRYVLHAPLGKDDEEFSIEGTAALVTDERLLAALAAAAGHAIRPNDLLFELAIRRCRWAIWENVGQPNTRAVRRRWDAP